MPEVYECLSQNGCLPDIWSAFGCAPDQNDAGPAKCNCSKECWFQAGGWGALETKCVPSDAGSHCDCVIDDDPVGSCEQLDFVCDVWTSCCRIYFDL
jgi:hypothetical protein